MPYVYALYIFRIGFARSLTEPLHNNSLVGWLLCEIAVSSIKTIAIYMCCYWFFFSSSHSSDHKDFALLLPIHINMHTVISNSFMLLKQLNFFSVIDCIRFDWFVAWINFEFRWFVLTQSRKIARRKDESIVARNTSKWWNNSVDIDVVVVVVAAATLSSSSSSSIQNDNRSSNANCTTSNKMWRLREAHSIIVCV